MRFPSLLAALLLAVVARAQEVPRAFVPASNVGLASQIAGVSNGGQISVIDGDGFLYRLMFEEVDDRPCYLVAEFWQAPAPRGISAFQRSVRTLNVCAGGVDPSRPRPGMTNDSRRWIGQQVTSSTLTLIDQISVIESRYNDRIKAARVRFGDLRAWRLTRTPVRLALTDFDSFRRPNADGATFSETSTCPQGLAAVGLIAYHTDHSITGLKLKCARPLRVDAPETPTMERRTFGDGG